MSETDEALRSAINNNQAWCLFVAERHDIASTQDNGYWQAQSDMPTFFPNLVTLTQGTDVDNILPSQGNYFVKDSFSELDLTGKDFISLFDATWYACRHHPINLPDANTCLIQQANDSEALKEWETLWRGEETFKPIYPATFIDHKQVAFWTAQQDKKIAGVTSFFDGQSLGIYNLWGDTDLQAALLAHLQTLQPDVAIVGYGDNDELAHLIPLGFSPLGALKVWGRFE